MRCWVSGARRELPRSRVVEIGAASGGGSVNELRGGWSGAWEVYRLEHRRCNRGLCWRPAEGCEGLDCELVYALVPRKGSLEEMAAQQERRAKRRGRQSEQRHTRRSWQSVSRG